MKSCMGELSFVLVASDRNANPTVLSPERGNIWTRAAVDGVRSILAQLWGWVPFTYTIM